MDVSSLLSKSEYVVWVVYIDMRKKKHGKALGIVAMSIALALPMMHATAEASDLVAIVDLEFIRETDRPAAVMCFGEREEDCHVWATLNLYKAKVRRVISGTESRKAVLVLFGRHALKKGNFRGVIATMNRLEATRASDPQYQMTEWGEKRELYCFPRREDDTGLELKEDDDERHTCYNAK